MSRLWFTPPRTDVMYQHEWKTYQFRLRTRSVIKVGIKYQHAPKTVTLRLTS